MRTTHMHILRSIVMIGLLCVSATAVADCVVLLHGLNRTDHSMNKLAAALRDEGFTVANVHYPSRQHPVEELSRTAVERGLAGCVEEQRIHFVTHSLGGILVRYYLANESIRNLGRVVMLGPPNQGSELVDRFRHVPGYGLINGPAGAQLGTDAASIPAMLGPVHFELGVIAGSESISPILSYYLPNPDDGKVSVARTRVAGMSDFIVVPHSHAFMMRAADTIQQTIAFLESGAFIRETTELAR